MSELLKAKFMTSNFKPQRMVGIKLTVYSASQLNPGQANFFVESNSHRINVSEFSLTSSFIEEWVLTYN